MTVQSCFVRLALSAAVFACFTVLPAIAQSENTLGNHSVNGQYVLAFDGAFSSAPPPFTGDVLQFRAAMVGRLMFDGVGLVSGELTLIFHHPAIPFAVRSQKSLRGSYTVAPHGRVIISVDEFPLGDDGLPGPVKGNSVVYECYIVRRHDLSKCVTHSLVSFQQGPEPRVLPMTMSGSLQRRH